jgi:hypothetical protein
MIQTSAELFRRGVVLPTSREALMEIQADQITDDELFRVAAFSDSEQFYRVWATGVFLQINRSCGLMIDDYESEEIASSFDAIVDLLRSAEKHEALVAEDRHLLRRIRELAIEAKAMNTSLFFIF